MPAHVFHIAKDNGPVGEGATESFRATVSAIIKTNDVQPTCVANEFIAAGLGHFLGLPLAPGALVNVSKSTNTLGYACLQFNLTNESLPYVDPPALVSALPRLATGVVVFDILIANPDRHIGNLSAVVHSDKPRLLVFDHSHALLSYDPHAALLRLEQLNGRLGISGGSVTGQNRHCLMDELTDGGYFGEWIGRVRSLPNHFIEDLCTNMRDHGLIGDVEAAKLRQFLCRRRDQLKEIIESHRHEFTGIRQWGLPF